MSILLNRHLISPNLVIVYVGSDNLTMPDGSKTIEQFSDYYGSLEELLGRLKDVVGKANESFSMVALSAWDFLEQLSSGDFYVGDGEVTWVEIGGEGVPTSWNGYAINF